MKKLNLKKMKTNLFLGLAIATTIFTSCGEDGTSDIIINNTVTNNGGNSGTTTETIELNGNYTSDLTLNTANSYVIAGPVIFESGTTLTIPAGMTIKAAATGADVYLAIAQGAKIDAQGTANQPIIFTSNASTPNKGDWGGLILLGKAPINKCSS